MILDARQKLFLILSSVFVTSLVVGDIIGGKLFQLSVGSQTFVITVGMIPFPITFVLTDLLSEFYGRRAAGLVTMVGFFMALFTVAVLWAAVQVPWAPLTRGPEWKGMTEAAFDNVFAGSRRILVASMVAYLIAQFLDISTFHRLKRLSANRFLWLRATGSTVVSQLVDTVVIQSLAWYGILSTQQIFDVVKTSYLVKVVIAIALTPVVYVGHAMVERWLGLRPVVLGPDGEPLEAPARAA